MKQRIILFILLLLPVISQAQNGAIWDKYFYTGRMAIGKGVINKSDSSAYSHSSSWLEIGKDSTTKGLLIPRVTSTSVISSPKRGLMVYQYSDSTVQIYTGAAWEEVGGSGGGGVPVDSAIYATRYWTSQNFLEIGDSTIYLTPSDAAAAYQAKSDTSTYDATKYDLDTLSASAISVNTSGFYVAHGSNVQTFAQSVDSSLLRARATGWQYGGLVTGSGSGNVAVTAGAGGILSNQNPANPTYHYVQWSADTLSLPNGLSYIYVDSLGNVSSTTTEPSHSEYRHFIWLERVNLISGSISGQTSIRMPIQQYSAQIWDVFRAVGLIKRDLTVSAASTNLQVQISAGEIYQAGANAANDPLNPHEVTFTLQNPQTFRIILQGGGQTVDTQYLDPQYYDLSNVKTLIPGSGSRAQIWLVKKFPGGNVRIFRGQKWYHSITQAFDSLAYYTPVLPTSYNEAMTLGYIITRKDATDLSDGSQAIFVNTNKFGNLGGGTVGNVTSQDLDDVLAEGGTLTTDRTIDLNANDLAVNFNAGGLQFNDGNQQNGYVWTSDASGFGSWQASGGSTPSWAQTLGVSNIAVDLSPTIRRTTGTVGYNLLRGADNAIQIIDDGTNANVRAHRVGTGTYTDFRWSGFVTSGGNSYTFGNQGTLAVLTDIPSSLPPSDGDKGDITVSSSGTNWQIDPATVGVTEISATGTPDSTKYLRGDGKWQSEGIVHKYAYFSGLSATTTAVFTTESGKGDFVPLYATCYISSVTGVASGTMTAIITHTGHAGSQFSFSFTASEVNNTGVGQHKLATVGAAAKNAFGGGVTFNITVSGAHTGATDVTYRFDMFGFYTNP